MRQRIFYILIILFLQCQVLYSQNYTLSYRLLDNENGVLGGRVNSFYEDENGFIWLGTPKGIARYDGHQFRWLTPTNSKLRGIPGADKFAQDDEGNLWIFNFGAIDIINPKTFEVQSLKEKLGIETSIKGAIQDITTTHDHYILFKDKNSDTWYKYHSTIGLVKAEFIPQKTIRVGILGNSIWLYSSDKETPVEVFNYKTEEKIFEYFLNNEYFFPVNASNYGKDIIAKVNRRRIELLEFTNDSLKSIFKYEISKDRQPQFINVHYLPEDKIFITNFNAKKTGLSVIDIKNQRLIPIENSNEQIITDRKKIWVSKNGTLYAPSLRNVVMMRVKPTYFQQYPHFKPHRGIRVWGDYLYAGHSRVSLKNPQDIQTRDDEYAIWGTNYNIKDELWAGSNKHLLQIDPVTHTVKKVIPFRKGNYLVWSILKSKEDKWWLGTYHNGIWTSDFSKKDTILRFDHFNEFTELKGIRVNHIIEDGDYIWASTIIGLFLIHKEKGVVQKYSADGSSGFQLPIIDVYFLHKDAQNNYWLGTSSEGLIQFQLNDKKEISTFKQYTEEDGLSSNIVYAILEDEKERLWISTYNGISCLDKKTKSIQAFSKEDGIRELEFNRNSYTKTEDGRIFFGSLKGITAFYPDEVLNAKTYDAPLFITQFFTYNENNDAINQTQKIQQTQKIVIQPSERFFRLNVAMLDIFHANKLRYSYQIEGLFKEYQIIDGNTIEIGGLPYGRYTLKVKGQGADKRFSSQELSIPLIVVRPFYLRWWFLLLSLILAGLSIYQFYQWRVRQFEDRKRELELLVQERTVQIRKDKEVIEEQAMQLKELDELKSKFFANISHELRTPLTLILSPLDKLLKEKTFTNNQFTYLSMMRQNGGKLLKRINELLDLSRLDANRLEINERPTFLYPFFKTQLSTFESAAQIKHVRLLFQYHLNENTQALIDDNKVEKIITNYLSNALKFTPQNGTISLRVERQQEKMLVSVSDTGVGILPNDLIKIFDRFYQSKSEKQHQGSGIGLSLCRELAKVLNGNVWATSEIDKGSIFYLELPLIETFNAKEAVEKASTIILPTIIENTQSEKPFVFNYRPTILIVEDNSDLRQFLTMILQEEYNVIAAKNGKEALRQLKPPPNPPKEGNTLHLPSFGGGFNLIISDIMMPIMDGIELLKAIKQTKELQHIPMIMLTARQSIDVKINALRIGVDDYLTKPFREEELKARVANLIRNSQNRVGEEPFDQTVTAQIKAVKQLTPADYDWLAEIEQAVLKHISNPKFKLTDLAAEMAISYSLLKQKIKKITGLTPKQYERSIKLHEARKMLKSGAFVTVSEVMYQLGFEHLSYFSKIYKQEFGIMPTEELK